MKKEQSTSELISRCSAKRKMSSIKIAELGRKATFSNPKRRVFWLIDIDGCVVNTGRRADYCLTNHPRTAALIIELKGRDVEHAFTQLEATTELLRRTWKNNTKLRALIVCNQVPCVSNLLQKLQSRFAKKFDGSLVKVTTQNKIWDFDHFFR